MFVNIFPIYRCMESTKMVMHFRCKNMRKPFGKNQKGTSRIFRDPEEDDF